MKLNMNEKMMEKAREKWTEIFNTLCSSFGSFYDFIDNPCSSYFDDWSREFKQSELYKEYEGDLSWDSGISKACFFFGNDDYVIKVPFCDVDEDYCEKETQMFVKAEVNGVDEYFAETKQLMTYVYDNSFSVDVYISARANMDRDLMADMMDSYSHHDEYDPELAEQEEDDETFNTLYSMNGTSFPAIKDIFEGSYSNDLEDLWDFIIRLRINDLHKGNVGFTINDKPVFIDYSGYDC